MKGQNGLFFGHRGSVISEGVFPSIGETGDDSETLEVWLEPGHNKETTTILSFGDSAHVGSPFSLQQAGDGLRIQRHNIDDHGVARTAWLTIEHVFQTKEPLFVTIVLREHETTVYLDGALSEVSAILGMSRNNLTGRLVLADSPDSSSSWSGYLYGLAIYHQPLTATQVAQHWQSWTAQRPTVVVNDTPAALYLFNEGGGTIIHNQVNRSTNLNIPAHYSLLHHAFLVPAWREYKPTWSYWEDFCVNVAGFVPLGLCLAAYFSSVRVIKWRRTSVIAIGFLVSLTIEVLQFFLPTRSSGTSDLFTNTLGTGLGVAIYGSSFVQRRLSKTYSEANGFSITSPSEAARDVVAASV